MGGPLPGVRDIDDAASFPAVRRDQPFVLHPIAAEGRSWRELAVSVVVHALVIALVLFGTRKVTDVDGTGTENGTPIAMAPEDERETFRVPEERERQQEVPPERPRALGPDSDRPEEPVPRERGDPVPPPEPDPVPAEAAGTPAARTPETPNRVETANEVASRGGIGEPPTSPFGTRPSTITAPTRPGLGSGVATSGVMGRAGISGTDNRNWRPSFDEAAGSCPEVPDLGLNPDGTPVLASVVGYVFDDRGNPLQGAHLQIVGAPFTTFSDRNGAYRLEFDPRMLGRCRVQYVRVQADGFRGQTLVLAVGRSVRSDDVVLKR